MLSAAAVCVIKSDCAATSSWSRVRARLELRKGLISSSTIWHCIKFIISSNLILSGRPLPVHRGEAESSTSPENRRLCRVLAETDIQRPCRKWLQRPKIGHSNNSQPLSAFGQSGNWLE
jgi:hypothetical protein